MVRFIIPKLYQIIRFVLCGASGVCCVSLCRTIYYCCSLPMLLYTFRSPPHISLTRIFTTPIPAPAKKTLFRPGKHLVRHRVVDFETPDNNFSQLPTDKTKIELRPAFPRPTEEPHIPANTRPSAVRTTDDPETLRINSLPPKNKKVANEYRLQPSRPPGRLRRERLPNLRFQKIS